MRIDAHQHFWEYSAARHSWITEEMAVLKRDYLPTDLLGELTTHQIDGTIAVQADQSENETEFLLALAERNEFILGVVGWVDLASPAVEERVERYRHRAKLRGFRHIVQSEPDDQFMLRADFRRGITALGRLGLTYDILIYPKQLPSAIELVASHPEQKFVLDHLAKPDIRSGRTDGWEQGIRELASSANVFCKLSGLVTEADWASWKPQDFRKYLDVAFEVFGADRLMFGSDWPVCLLAGNYARIVGLIRSYLKGFSSATAAAIFGENAARFYGLRVPSHEPAA